MEETTKEKFYKIADAIYLSTIGNWPLRFGGYAFYFAIHHNEPELLLRAAPYFGVAEISLSLFDYWYMDYDSPINIRNRKNKGQ
ncbi:MAG TPA: hypothetical protein VJH34_02640 [archaeon]|nr:hypothetical protein [archaeon]